MSTDHPLRSLQTNAAHALPATPPAAREAHVAQRLAEDAADDEYSNLQQYLEWPTTSVEEELDRRKSLFKLVEGQEKKRFRVFVEETKKTTSSEPLDQRRLRFVQKEALRKSSIPPLRRHADSLLEELKRVEDEKGHASRDFLLALHDFHNQEILLYQACLRSEALYDYLELLEDRRYRLTSRSVLVPLNGSSTLSRQSSLCPGVPCLDSFSPGALLSRLLFQPSNRIPSERGGDASFKVLLAEDNIVNQKVALKFLESAGHQTEVVENGALALEAVKKNFYDRRIGEQMQADHGWVWPIHIGLHASESMRPVHVHVVSTDSVSPYVKRKEHYNAMNPTLSFFLFLDQIINGLKAKTLTLRPVGAYARLRDEAPLKSHYTGETFPSIGALQAHLEAEWRRKGEAAKAVTAAAAA